jgi:hypothetical protein
MATDADGISLPELATEGQRQTTTPNWDDVEDDYQAHEDECKYLQAQLKPTHRREQRHNCCSCDKEESRSIRFRRNVRRMINFLNISPRQKSLILDRYVSLVEQYAVTKRRFTRAYGSMRFFTTLFGIVTPALVSIQPFFGQEATSNPMYWSVFLTSLLAALLNGYISLYKVDKKFTSSTRAYLQLESEGWQYFSLVGKYGEVDPMTNILPTHANRFTVFMQTIEKIRKGEVRINYSNHLHDSSTSSRSRSEVDLRGGGRGSEREAKERQGTVVSQSVETTV